LYLKNICLLIHKYNIKVDISNFSKSYNYSTRLKSKANIIVPKMRTVFGQQCPKHKFIQFCFGHDLNKISFKNL